MRGKREMKPDKSDVKSVAKKVGIITLAMLCIAVDVLEINRFVNTINNQLN